MSVCANAPARQAYSELYLEDAMANLADFFDYAVNDYGAEPDEIASIFAASALARSFEQGTSWAVSGKSGYELFAQLSYDLGYSDSALIEPAYRPDKTAQYWAGSVCAYAQWRLDVSFEQIFEAVPLSQVIALYHPWHETSEERFCELLQERMTEANSKTALARLRIEAGLSQRELSERSGVSLRAIQMYEQRNKNIDHAKFESVRALARTLRCPIERLYEPSFLMNSAA